jgi:hypothetical protein
MERHNPDAITTRSSHNLVYNKRPHLSVNHLMTPPPFIEVPVSSQQSEWSYICVVGLFILIFDLDIVPTVWYFLFFMLLCVYWV